MDDVVAGAFEMPQDDELLESVELVRAAPIRATEWLLAPVIVGLVGVAGTVAFVWLGSRQEPHFGWWLFGGVAALLVPYAVLLGRRGWQAFTLLSADTVRRLLHTRFLGLWGFSAASLASGIVGGSGWATFIGFSTSHAVYVSFVFRNTERESELARLVRRWAPAFIGECVFAIVAPPLAALIVSTMGLPRAVADDYQASAFAVPVYGIAALVVLLLSRRRQRG